MAGGTVTYRYPRATAPDNTLMLSHDAVVADLAFGAAANDDDTDIVHALNLAPADGSVGQPHIRCIKTAQGIVQTLPVITFKDKDTITVHKQITGANTDGTYRFTIKRPHSMGR
jgi:hypothetical protein